MIYHISRSWSQFTSMCTLERFFTSISYICLQAEISIFWGYYHVYMHIYCMCMHNIHVMYIMYIYIYMHIYLSCHISCICMHTALFYTCAISIPRVYAWVSWMCFEKDAWIYTYIKIYACTCMHVTYVYICGKACKEPSISTTYPPTNGHPFPTCKVNHQSFQPRAHKIWIWER